MTIRKYDFVNVGVETGTQPTAGTPTADDDLVTKGYVDSNAMQGSASVADVTALQAIAAADRTNGMTVVVRSSNTIYIFQSGSSDTADGTRIVSPSAGTGRWVRHLPSETATTGDQAVGRDLTVTRNLTISGVATVKEIATPAAPAATYHQIYAKSDGKIYHQTPGAVESELGSGASGSSGINYLSANPSAETDTTGWITYDDAAATPVDGTGGTVTTTWTRSTSSPLRGTGSFLLSKDAANRSGEGASYAFTLDTADKSKVIQISFDVDATDTNYVADDIMIYIYDVTNAALIYPASQGVKKASYQFQTTFVATTSTSYRLLIHYAGTNASAVAVKFDNIIVGPQLAILGVPFQSFKSWTPTGSWVSNVTYTGLYRRDGQNATFSVKVATSGAPTSAALTITLPSGMTIDTTALTDTGAGLGSLLSSGEAVDGSTPYRVFAKYNSTTSVAIAFQNNASGAEANVTQAAPFTFGASDYVDIKFTVPIAEWAGSSVYLNQAQPEYAYNSTTGDTDDTTAFAYGPTGGLVPQAALTAPRSKRIRFLTPIQATDVLLFQIDNDGSGMWSTMFYSRDAGDDQVRYYDRQGSSYYGAGGLIKVSSTDVDVRFGQYANITSSTYGAAGIAWSSSHAQKWRVVKVPGQIQSAGQALPTAMSYESATALGCMEYLHGTTYSGGLAPTVTLSAGGGSLTTVNVASFRPKQMQGNTWVMSFNIEVLLSSAARTGPTFNINGVTFYNTGGSEGQAVQHDTAGSAVPSYGLAQKNASTILLGHASATTTSYRISGLVKLASKPTWAY